MPGLLTTAELNALRTEFTAAMPDTATIKTTGIVDDGYGGQSEGTISTIDDVPAMVMPTGDGVEATIAARLGVNSPYTVYLPYGTDVTAKDQIIIQAVTYEVKAVKDRFSYDVNVTCICSRSE